MDIDFDALIDGLTNVIHGSLESDLPQIREYAKKIVEEEKETLQLLANLRQNGDISDEEFMSELEDQKGIVQNQLLAIGAMSTAAAQKATNAAIKFLGDTVLTAVKAIL
jgi:thymidylate synthase ThyX